MIIYSVTITVRKDIESDWLNWMKENHIPDVMKIGYFLEWQMQKLLSSEVSVDEMTYVINYFALSLDLYKLYIENEAPRLQNEHNQKFNGKYKASRAVYSLISK